MSILDNEAALAGWHSGDRLRSLQDSANALAKAELFYLNKRLRKKEKLEKLHEAVIRFASTVDAPKYLTDAADEFYNFDQDNTVYPYRGKGERNES